MTIAYLDCTSGISGDMTLGALIDLGFPTKRLNEAIRGLGLGDGVHVHARRVLRCGISGRHITVHGAGDSADHHHSTSSAEGGTSSHTHSHSNDHSHGGSTVTPGHPRDHEHSHDHDHSHGHSHHTHDHVSAGGHSAHRGFSEIARLIENASLPTEVCERSIEAFRKIGSVEADIHGTTLDKIHFHEIGAVDSIVDLVGSILGFHELGVSRIVSSPVSVGGGTIQVAHGLMPVPAPATARLLEGIPVRTGPVATTELTTPTGAALLSVLCSGYGPMPDMVMGGVGYGAGTRDFPGHANLLRICLGTATDPSGLTALPVMVEEVVVLTAEIDDMSGEAVGFALDRIRSSGALDALVEPVQMKKGRPGIRLQVLCLPGTELAAVTAILRDTSTLGVRAQTVRRFAVHRRAVEVETPFGTVRGKAADWGGEVLRVAPEYEDAKAAAERAGVPLHLVMEAFARAIEKESR